MATYAFVFPGQGSQAVGMGRSVAETFPCARHVLEEVDDALGQHLSRLIAEGPEEELVLTENAQPALMAVSMAILRVLEEEGGMRIDAAALAAGHSLGEYTALAAAGALGVADAARLLKLRGRAMQRAVPVGQGAMAALLGVGLETAGEIAEAAAQGEVCQPANDNAPDQVVLSGAAGAIDRALPVARERGAKRAVPLKVSAPFHCALMAPAAEEMQRALADVAIAEPVIPVVANVTAEPNRDVDAIRTLLVEQVTGMVRWRESVLAMKTAGVDTVVEIGAGKVLSGLTRRIDPDLEAVSVADLDGIEAFLKRP